MNMSIGAAAAVAQPAIGQEAVTQASQNIFEAMANTATSAQGTSPSQLGGEVLERLNGFIDRSKRFAERADALAAGTAPPPAAPQPPAPDVAASVTPGGEARTPDRQVDRVLQSMNMMFDHSIETQMVVRGATQVSGAVNTLLRGQ